MLHPICRALGALFTLALIVLVPVVRAQQATPLRIVLTCQNTYCDTDFFRTELKFADFVRDVTDAQVQVLVTSQSNGAGGETYTLRFLGQGALAGRNDELTVSMGGDATEDEARRAIARSLAAGLLPYAARVGPLDRFSIAYNPPAATSAAPVTPEADPWNRWVYTLSANSNFNGDANYSSFSLYYNASARRVTEQWKTSVSLSASDEQTTFVLSDGTKDRVRQTGQNANAQAVYSLGEHWSAGGDVNAFRSSYGNTDLNLRVSPGIEYDFFPYSENTKHIVTLRYQVGAGYAIYNDTTIYRKLREPLIDHRLSLGSNFQQPWGSFFVSATANQYLNHFKQYSLSTFSNANIRLYRGLSVNFYVQVNLLRNQRNISGEGVSDDDIYTRRRALETGYSYFGGAGLRYTFGSATTGAVNPRFSSGGTFFISN